MDINSVTEYVAKEDKKDEELLEFAYTRFGIALKRRHLYDGLPDDSNRRSLESSHIDYAEKLPMLRSEIQRQHLERIKTGKESVKSINSALIKEHADSEIAIKESDLNDGIKISQYASDSIINIGNLVLKFSEMQEQQKREFYQKDEILIQKRNGLAEDANNRGPAERRRNLVDVPASQTLFINNSRLVGGNFGNGKEPPIPIISNVQSLANQPDPAVVQNQERELEEEFAKIFTNGKSQEQQNSKMIMHCWKCSDCNFTCPVDQDISFRNHIRIRHRKDKDDTAFLKMKVRMDIEGGVGGFLRCKVCKHIVLARPGIQQIKKLEEHRLKCSKERSLSQLYEPYVEAKYQCGICNRKAYLSRMDIALHVESQHQNFSKRFLYDPFFRCAQCFTEYRESKDLIVHLHSTSSCKPNSENIVELTTKLRWCGIIGKGGFHSDVDSAQNAYIEAGFVRCLLCSNVSMNRDQWAAHWQKCHSQPGIMLPDKKYVCPFCPNVNNSNAMVIRKCLEHIVDEHYNKCSAGKGPIQETKSKAAQKSKAKPNTSSIPSSTMSASVAAANKQMLIQSNPPPPRTYSQIKLHGGKIHPKTSFTPGKPNTANPEFLMPMAPPRKRKLSADVENPELISEVEIDVNSFVSTILSTPEEEESQSQQDNNRMMKKSGNLTFQTDNSQQITPQEGPENMDILDNIRDYVIVGESAYIRPENSTWSSLGAEEPEDIDMLDNSMSSAQQIQN